MTQVGAMWFLMDRVFKLPFTPLNAGALNGDLSRFTCIVLPEGPGISLTSNLREWINRGGVAVGLSRPSWALGSSNLVELSKIKGDPQSLPGSLFRARLDDRSFLSYGYPAGLNGYTEIAVPFDGDTFYQARKEGGSVVTLDADPKAKKLLSGWEYEDDTEKNLAGTVWLQDVPVGRGHAVIFFQDPTDRALWPGLHKMLLNAMIAGE